MKTVFLLYVFVTNLFAQHLDPEAVELLDNVQKNLSPSLCDQCSRMPISYQKSRQAKNLQYCAVSLCGPSNNNPTAIITDANLNKIATPEGIARAKKIEPTIRKVLEKSLARKTAIMKKLRDIISSKQMQDQDFQKIHPMFKRQIFYEIAISSFEILLDRSKPIQDRVRITYYFPPWANENYKKVITEFAESVKLSQTKNFYLIKRYKIFSDEEVKANIERDITIIEKGMTSQPENQLDANQAKLLTTAKIKLQNNEEISYDELRNVNLLLEKYSSQKKINFDDSCSSSECSQALKDFFLNEMTVEKIDAILEKTSKPEQILREVNKCKAGLISDYIRSGDKKRANEQLKDAMAAIEKNVYPMFSSHSRELLRKSLSKLRTNSSKPSSKFGMTWKSFEKESATFLKDNSDPVANLNVESSLSKLFKMLEKNVPVVSNPCDDVLKSNLWDATEPEKKKIYISDYSCTHDVRGEQIIAHEIGHNINYLFSKLPNMSKESLKSYLELRKCVAKNHPKLGRAYEGFFTFDTWSTEEDMADYISNMAYPGNKDLYSCGLLFPDITSNSYLKPQFVPEDHADVTHSPPLLRVVMESIQKGITTPISCKEAMEEVRDEVEFNKCGK